MPYTKYNKDYGIRVVIHRKAAEHFKCNDTSIMIYISQYEQ